ARRHAVGVAVGGQRADVIGGAPHRREGAARDRARFGIALLFVPALRFDLGLGWSLWLEHASARLSIPRLERAVEIGLGLVELRKARAKGRARCGRSHRSLARGGRAAARGEE